ncbi:MAG: hypothetical protein IJ646_05190 [Clostridia bacterium]|nr:hypothetical protein [Clostridia bacterium]
MFGSKKIQELERQLNELQQKFNATTSERDDLSQKLAAAGDRIADLENQLNDFDLARLKEEARAMKAEYEGLRDLYKQKNQEFDDAKEEKEQTFARDQAIQRHNLENEIRDNRQANRDYVTSTVKTFGESYNYYLNQIKLLMDALGNVASRTGEALFSGDNADLKASFGSKMRDSLRTGMEALGPGSGDLIVIGAEEEEEPVIEEEAPVIEEEAEVVEAVEEAQEATEETVDALIDELNGDKAPEEEAPVEDAAAPEEAPEETPEAAEEPEEDAEE